MLGLRKLRSQPGSNEEDCAVAIVSHAELANQPSEEFNRASSPSGSVVSSIKHSVTTNRTLNKEQEEDLIRELQIQSRNQLKLDPLKELDEALMDRTTAQLTLKVQTSSTVNTSHKQRVNSSNFDKATLPAV